MINYYDKNRFISKSELARLADVSPRTFCRYLASRRHILDAMGPPILPHPRSNSSDLEVWTRVSFYKKVILCRENISKTFLDKPSDFVDYRISCFIFSSKTFRMRRSLENVLFSESSSILGLRSKTSKSTWEAVWAKRVLRMITKIGLSASELRTFSHSFFLLRFSFWWQKENEEI